MTLTVPKTGQGLVARIEEEKHPDIKIRILKQFSKYMDNQFSRMNHDAQAELLTGYIRARIMTATGVHGTVFEEDILDTERALGIDSYRCIGSLLERRGVPYIRIVSNEEIERDLRRFRSKAS